jgi:ribosome silencing factor RsfS/YbeB/iojap
MDAKDIDALIRTREKPRRYEHTLRVTEMATELARLNGVDVEKARTAALFHDLCKDGGKEGNDLAHAGEAADLMQSEFGVTDEDVLNAVRYHTTGRARMSDLELVIFLADTLEPARDYEGVAELRDLVYGDLRGGALKVLKELNRYLVKQGVTPAKDSLDAIEWLEGETGDKEGQKERQEIMKGEPNNQDAVSISALVTRGGAEGAEAKASADLEQSRALALALAKAASDKKGRDIVVLDISGKSSFADFFVNATAANTRMLSTIRDEVEDVLAERGLGVKGAEGKPESGWVLVDCGDVIVNLFLAEQREKYQIEKIWRDAARVAIDEDAE